MRQGPLEHGARLVELTGLDIGTSRAGVEQGQQTAVGRCAADGIHRETQVAERLQWLPAVLVMLAPCALDEGGELAVSIRMGPANPLQPRRRVVRAR